MQDKKQIAKKTKILYAGRPAKGELMLDTDTFKDYVTLHNKKKRLEVELKDVKASISDKEQFLIDNLADNDMSKISISGKTIYTKVNVFAKIKSRAEAIQVLRDEDFGEFVKEGINAQSISKLVRDLIEENGELPEGFGDVITKGSKSVLGVTNS